MVLLGVFAAYSSVKVCCRAISARRFPSCCCWASSARYCSEKCEKSISSAWNALRNSEDGVSVLFHSLKVRSVFLSRVATTDRPTRDNHRFFCRVIHAFTLNLHLFIRSFQLPFRYCSSILLRLNKIVKRDHYSILPALTPNLRDCDTTKSR